MKRKAFVAAFLPPLLLIGCRAGRTLKVLLPIGYKGHVSIGCNNSLRRDLAVDFDSSSRGVNIACPGSAKQVVVVRGTVVINPAVAVELTGDGVPVEISFDVK